MITDPNFEQVSLKYKRLDLKIFKGIRYHQNMKQNLKIESMYALKDLTF